MPDWITLDLGIGAVGGSIITGAVAVYIDYRRRRDERTSRYADERLRAYKALIAVLDTVVDRMVLFAEFKPFWPKLENSEILNEQEAKVMQQVGKELARR